MKLNQSTFNGCSGLEKVYIPSTMKNIDYNVFGECMSIKEVIFNGTEKEWKKIKIDSYNTYLNISRKTFLKNDSE